MLKTITVAVFATLAVLCMASPAAAQKGGQAQHITIRVCNNTNENANVALSYEPVGSQTFYNEGWYGVPANSCRDLVDTDNGYIYAYAEVLNDSTRYWSGNNSQCVMYPGPYAFWSTTSQYCESGQEARNFQELHTDQWGVFTWNLNPES